VLALLNTSNKEPENEESDGEDTKSEAGYLVPVGDPSVPLWFGLELARLNDSLHHLMPKEVLIVHWFAFLWLAKVCEIILFLLAHFVTSTSTTLTPPTFAATMQASSKEVKVLAQLAERVNW
jgi:hypothetical protein